MKILFYRSHNDITVLYESFVVKRKLLKEAVRRNIEEFYAKDRVKSNELNEVSISLKKNRVEQSWCLITSMHGKWLITSC